MLRCASVAPAAASPPQTRPRPHSCGFPEHAPDKDGVGASQWRSFRNAERCSCSCRRGRYRGIGPSGQPPPELQMRPGLSPQQRAQRDVPSTGTEVLPPQRRQPPPHQEASPADMGRGQGGGSRGKEGCPSEFSLDVYFKNQMPGGATGSAFGRSSQTLLSQRQTKIPGIVARLPHPSPPQADTPAR